MKHENMPFGIIEMRWPHELKQIDILFAVRLGSIIPYWLEIRWYHYFYKHQQLVAHCKECLVIFHVF